MSGYPARGKKRPLLVWILGVFLTLLAILAVLVGPTVYRVVHGLDRYETAAPTLPRDLATPAILVFSKTNGFRDDASIDAANAMFASMTKARRWGLFQTENGAVFNPAQLARFKVVIWNSVSGDVLTPSQRDALRRYLESGGAFIGLHGAGGDPSYRWKWYVDNLIGAQFIGHTMWPQKQSAVVHVVDSDHPVMTGLPMKWRRDDEWYSFDRSVRSKGYKILATVDEGSYHPSGLFGDDLHMGRDHPVVWTHCVGRGRAFYSAMGHFPESYSEPAHRKMLENAVAWTLEDIAPCLPPDQGR